MRPCDRLGAMISIWYRSRSLGEGLEQPIQPPPSLPLLKAPMAGLIRRIAARQGVRGCAGAQHPEHAVQDRARIGPRPPAAIGATTGTERRFEYGPLSVSE